MTITAAELAAMPRTTPTTLAEARYASRGKPMPVGQSGLQVPAPRTVYRPTVDGPLLDKIARTAFGAYERTELPLWEREQIAALLVQDIDQRVPLAHREILALYGHAKDSSTLVITLSGPVWFRLEMAAPALLTAELHRFTTVPDALSTVPRVPEAAVTFFERVSDVERLRRDVRRIAGWPSQFKVKERRWPRWEEIEAAWPLVGRWLAAEREHLPKG